MSQNSKRVLLLVDSSTKSGRSTMLGIAKYSRLHGPWILYMEPQFYRKPAKKQFFEEWIIQQNVDGIISQHDVVKNIAKRTKKIPVIVAHYIKESLLYIASNCEAIGKMAAEYFLNRGFRNFAYCGFNDMLWSQKRCESFCKRISEAGFRTRLYKPSKKVIQLYWEKERPFLCDWLSSLPLPIAIMACNDYRGRQISEACRNMGLLVPEQVVILGVDNDEFICDMSYPPLSSISLSLENTGYQAAALLDKLMTGTKITNQTIITHPLSVVTRESTDIMAIDDKDIAVALNFIRNNRNKIIWVDDVVDAVNLSRRVLEKRFRKVKGCSIHDEIKRTRIEHIAQLLVETNLSVSQIALNMGFPDVNHISQQFSKAMGMTPLTYRKRYGTK